MQTPGAGALEKELLRVPQTEVLHGPKRVSAARARHKHLHPGLERPEWEQQQPGRTA